MPAIEVKGDGEHGLFFCSPSIHPGGCRYEIIGMKVPAIVNEEQDYELHIDNICRKYGLRYLDDDTFESRVYGLTDANHRNKSGERHNNTLTIINHYIYKNAYKLPEEQQTEQQLEHIIVKYNRGQNDPPLPDQEVDRMFHDALRRSATRLKAEESAINAHHRKLRQQKTGQQQTLKITDQEKQNLIEEASETIMKTNEFLTIEESKEILYYNGNGVFVPGGEVLIEKEAESLFGYKLSNKDLSEIKGHIMRRTYHKRSEIDPDVSVLTGTLTALHGIKNVSNVSLSTILKNQFALSDLEGKDVNIDAELSSTTISDTAILKKLTGKQPIRIERKNQRAYDVKLHAKLFFSANKIPQTADDSDAYYRRQFEDNNADPDLLMNLTTEEELSGIFNVLMTSLRRVLRSKRIFVNEKTIQERREKYEMSSDPIGSFIKIAVAEDSIARQQKSISINPSMTTVKYTT
jgi:hypothetical protein